jgi:hypothetical protein
LLTFIAHAADGRHGGLFASQRLSGSVESAAARAIVGEVTPFCFYVLGVRFFYDGEKSAAAQVSRRH